MTTDQPSPTKKRLSLESFAEKLAVPLLLLVLLLAAMLRFSGLNWDDSTHLHPDERFLTSTTIKLTVPDSFLTYLRTSESTLNPYNVGEGFYVYGNFPMTLTRIAAEAASTFCQPDETAPSTCNYNYIGYDGLHLLGRFLSSLVDLIAVAFLFFIGRRLYGWQVGLLAAALMATAVMPIQQSHFYTMDTWASTLTTITIYAAVRAAGLGDKDNPAVWRWRWWLIFGIMLGLTIASRINLAPLALIINLSAIIWLHQSGHTWESVFETRQGATALTRVFIGILLAAILSIIVFRFANPYAFADPTIARNAAIAEHGVEPTGITYFLQATIGLNPQWVSNMKEIQIQQSPDATAPPAWQWTDRTPILFPLSNMILYGMGIAAGVMAWFGFFWAGWRLIKLRPDWTAHAIPVVWSGLYFMFMATRWVKSIRYFLPIYPTLLLLAGWALIAICRRAVGSKSKAKQIAAAGLTAVILISSFAWAIAFTEIYRQPMTRNAASTWMYENVPTAITLLYETDDGEHELQLPIKQFDWTADSYPLALSFALPEDGIITAVRLNYLSDPLYLAGQPLSRAQLKLNLGAIGGDGVTLDLGLDDQPRRFTADINDLFMSAGVVNQLVVEHVAGFTVHATTSNIANEHWDDPLPTNIGGRAAYSMYYNGDMYPVTHPDSPEKRLDVIQWLDKSDYIALSSQRAMWSLPRNPTTYPMMIRYYEALFSGELGFELVHQAHGDIHIGPLYISDTTGKIGWGKNPDVGWPPPGDLAAEEAFSVYDHPPVWIFQKTAAYNHDNTAAILNAVDLSKVIFMTPRQATENKLPPTLLLSDDDAERQQAGGTFADLFNPDGVMAQHPWLAAVVWWLAVILLSWLAFPVTFTAFNGLPDKGYALSRILSLLLVSYFGWLMGSLKWLPHTRATLLLGVLLIGLVSFIIYLRRRREIGAFLRGNNRFPNGRYILLVELLGIALFLLFIFIRLGNPDVWDIIWGGEKPMDLSYFTAVMKSTTFPPYDPWYAGGTLNYYYYGFVYVGAMAKLLAIPPAIAYNLGLAMLFSFVGLSVFSLAFNLVFYRTHSHRDRGNADQTLRISLDAEREKRWRIAITAGLIAMSLAILLGNLGEPAVMVNAWYKTGDPALEEKLPIAGTLARTIDGIIKITGGQSAPVYPGDYFWSATRIINAEPGEVQPISEFPFFTFLYGDLHAHMMSMPLQLLALGWAIGLVLGAGRGGRGAGALVVTFLVGGLAIGALRAINTWDFPTYLIIGALAVLFWAWKKAGRQGNRGTISSSPPLPRSPAPHLPAPLLFLGATAVLWSIAFLSFYPFAANYGTGYSSLSRWEGSYTFIGKYLVIWGLFLFFIIPHLAREFRDWTNHLTPARLRRAEPIGWLYLLAIFVYLLLIVTMLLKLTYWTMPLSLTLVLIAGLLSLRLNLSPPRRIVLVLTAAALFLTVFVEVFVLDGDIGRMNTVFKFYLQAWLMLSVVGGVTAVWTYKGIRKKTAVRQLWLITLSVLLFAAFLYPVLATSAKWRIRMNQDAPRTLDGMAFMPYVDYGDKGGQTVPLAPDYEAINWIQRNIDGSPVIMEAHSDNPYRSIGNRVAMYTGLPAVIGWDWHQRQQRAILADSGVPARIADVNAFYNAADIPFANFLIDKYGVEYIYVGQLEWVYYDPAGLAKFDQMVDEGLLEEVYRNPETSIYHVISE